jgi:NAD(P)-dependent dehydrogenase (short-subunit alcohol dehydrogenase family)
MTKRNYAIVTGASPSSIGFLAAKRLASPEFGFNVILACRSAQKGSEAEASIRSAHPSSHVKYLHLDLSSFGSIRTFVEDVRALDDGALTPRGDGRLTVLVNNAGVGFGRDTPFVETADGLEEIVGVNHFGTFLLTQLLLDDLRRGGSDDDAGSGGSGGGGRRPARVVTVSSRLHDGNAFSNKKKKSENAGENAPPSTETDSEQQSLLLPDFPRGILQSREGFDGFRAYKVSKLCNLWFTYELQRRLDGESSSLVIANAVTPGFIPVTGLTRRSGWLGTFFLHYVVDPWRYVGLGITRSPDEGADVIVQACTSDVASKGGQYFELPKGETTMKAIASSVESMDEAKATALWDLSVETCELKN